MAVEHNWTFKGFRSGVAQHMDIKEWHCKECGMIHYGESTDDIDTMVLKGWNLSCDQRIIFNIITE